MIMVYQRADRRLDRKCSGLLDWRRWYRKTREGEANIALVLWDVVYFLVYGDVVAAGVEPSSHFVV